MRKFGLLFTLIGLQWMMGQEATVVELEFTGLKRTKENFVKRLIKTKAGSVYDSVQVQKDLERLKRLPAIASASVQETQEGENVRLMYKVVENFTIIPGLRTATANDGGFAYRLSVFEFNFLGNNQQLGAFYGKNVFNSYGVFWENPFLFGNKFGIGANYQDLTTQEPIFFSEGQRDYRFNAKSGALRFLFSLDFKNEAELGVSLLKERYDILGTGTDNGMPLDLDANKWVYTGLYRYVDLDVDYQYIDGLINEFTGRYVLRVNGNAEGRMFLKSFLALQNNLLVYRKIGNRGNWANRIRLATTIGNHNSPFAPFVVDNQLNIRGAGVSVDRGISEIVWNSEYRHTVYERGWFAVQANGFADMGTWQSPGESLSSLWQGTSARLYTGLGFRLIHKKIFNAVFRLDYGVGIGNDAMNGMVFGIGQYF